MDTPFYSRIENSNASTICRNGIRDFVIQNPEYFEDAVTLRRISHSSRPDIKQPREKFYANYPNDF